MNRSVFHFFHIATLLFQMALFSCSKDEIKDIILVPDYIGDDITPNMFEGSDIERIQAAIDSAEGTTNKVVIPKRNSNGRNIWLIDEAILLPSNMKLILYDCLVQLSDKCRDNMIRSNNVGEGISAPDNMNYNISIIGIGNPVLRGADNPRATGDGSRTLVLESVFGTERNSYGTDSGKEGERQLGDWRNYGILVGMLDGFKIDNITIENAHAWAICHEKVINAELSNIRIYNPPDVVIKNKKQYIPNRDGINLRAGCKNFKIDNISGLTGDDFIALTILGLRSSTANLWGVLSGRVTASAWRGPIDNIENIVITNVNCVSKNRGVAIRAMDLASVNHVYVNGLVTKELKGYEKYHNAMLVGGQGYGNSYPGRINNIHAMNIFGDGGTSLIHVEQPIADCVFMNGIYKGPGDYVVSYNYIGIDYPKNVISVNNIGKESVFNVKEINMIKTFK